jgi:hypothetical protein
VPPDGQITKYKYYYETNIYKIIEEITFETYFDNWTLVDFENLLEIRPSSFWYGYVPTNMKTIEFNKFLIEKDPDSFYMMGEYLSDELCRFYVEKRKIADYWMIPKHFKNEKFYLLAIKHNPHAVIYISDKMKNKQFYKDAFKENKEILELIPSKYHADMNI